MLFKGEEGLKPTDALSGGEAVRLIFAKLMLTKDNVLVLDEPTNHLDLESIIALGDGLEKLRGHRLRRHPRPGPDRARSRPGSGPSPPRAWSTSSGTYDEFLEKMGRAAAGTRPGAASGKRR